MKKKNDPHLPAPCLVLFSTGEDGGELKDEKAGCSVSLAGRSPASSRRNVSKEGPEKLGNDSKGSLLNDGWGPARALCIGLSCGEGSPKKFVEGW